MAFQDLAEWVPEEEGSDVILRIGRTSAVERFSRREPMVSDSKRIPRSFGAGNAVVPKGGTYTEDATLNGSILLEATKSGKVFRMAEEDLDDAAPDAIKAKQLEWSTSFGMFMDNASLAVTAATNGVGGTIPYTSVYRAVTTAGAAGTLPDNGTYAANANYASVSNAAIGATGVAGSNQLPWKVLSGVLGKVEDSAFFDPENMLWVLAPKWRQLLRDLKADNGQPLIVTATTDNAQDRLAGIPIQWSMGARTSATATPSPTGNPLAIVGNFRYAVLGVRSGPEFVVIDGRSGASALTDETLLKARARRGFGVATPAAFGVVELVA